ncbi:MAG: hypothetical protein LBF57_03020 [Holosporaceae bacterium]|jgi:Flp pilus assembly protein CpaB|nr:hypothetical protein [Holosporaceae bacterium]
MNTKKDALPIIIASGIALIITGVIRWFIPGNSATTQKDAKKELSIPNIPLVALKESKKREGQVCVVAHDIKKDAKITTNNVTWKKWPMDAMQPYFIAKNEKEKMMNNVADYDKALKMWAAGDIPAGVPLTINLLVSEDPKKREEKEKKRKAEEAKKALQAEKARSTVRKGMRAVTFSIDQKSASASSLLSPGDIVDVLIMEMKENRTRTYTYRALKIIALDGVTKFEKKEEKTYLSKGGGGLLGSLAHSAGGLLSPKSVTLEVKEELVDIMLKQAGNSGVILSIRNQAELAQNSDDEITDTVNTNAKSSLLQNIHDMNQISARESLRIAEDEKKKRDDHFSSLMNDLNSGGKQNNAADVLISEQKRGEKMYLLLKEMNSADAAPFARAPQSETVLNPKSGKYEIVSGKVVGDETVDSGRKGVRIYRKMKHDDALSDQSGNKAPENFNSAEVSIGSGPEMKTAMGSPAKQ